MTCRAGWGIEGDRFYGYRPDYNGQITFFDWAAYLGAKTQFAVPALDAGAFRRNAVIEGLDLGAMIGREFSIGPITFRGMAEARPCYWMNDAVAPGAEEWLKGRGGLRARILTDGELKKGPAELALGAGQTDWLASMAMPGRPEITVDLKKGV